MRMEKLGYDSPRMTRDEATEICVYHLRVAAALFQLVPDDANVSLVEEINRTMDHECDRVPALAWAVSILAEYEKMRGAVE